MENTPALGATFGQDGTTFRVWALGHQEVAVHLDGRGSFDLEAEADGHFQIRLPNVRLGDRYKFSIDQGPLLPDLASRWQPEGIDGWSVVCDDRYEWTDASWPGPAPRDAVIYELHIGTFTGAGTWRAAQERLQHLKSLGVTVLQIMPIGAFKGSFGWGYDTALPYAPYAAYGEPDDVRAFIDAAHAHEIGVILDVVYNHAGGGNCYSAYSDNFLAKDRDTEWGTGFNFDDVGSKAVRGFILDNARYWIESFHFDGLRIDAAQAMVDESEEHILAALTRVVRAAGGTRSTYVVVENQPQERRMIVAPETGGYGMDAMYSDDFHHAAMVAATGHNDFYYRDYLGLPQELVSALKYGFLYQGQRSNMRDTAYGTYNLRTKAEHFVHFLENHDQIANSARGWRLSTLMSPARLRAITGLLLLGPQTPCLFQGQEFAASNPFYYFHGLEGQEAADTADGRATSLKNFPSVADPAMQSRLAYPADKTTFETSKLDWAETDRHAGMLMLHRDLIRLRQTDPAFSQVSERRIDGAVIGENALVMRYETEDGAGHRLLLLNLGRNLDFGVLAEPLLAPCDGHRWTVAWSSEHPDYGGGGRRDIDPTAFWTLQGDSMLVLTSEPAK